MDSKGEPDGSCLIRRRKHKEEQIKEKQSWQNLQKSIGLISQTKS